MDRLEEARLSWQRAQADLQAALAELERLVASTADAEAIQQARMLAGQRQDSADHQLQRYITYLGKNND